MADKPLFLYKRFGFRFEVYPNRIDVVDKRGLGGFIFPKRQTILSKNVSGVSVEGVSQRLHIVTNDGKTFKYIIGRKVQKAREAIVSTL